MTIGRISGPMLTRNLERQGYDLSIDGNLTYFDVTNRKIGINIDVPVSTLDVYGNVFAGNGVTVGSRNTAIYRLPNYAPPSDGRIIVSTANLDSIWSSIVRVNEANALVTISGSLDVFGNVFAGNGVTVGSRNTAIYRLPDYAPPPVGRIIVSTANLDLIWSNIVQVNEANALVTISGSSNITNKLFVGNLITVGNNNVELYSLPETAPGFGQMIISEGLPSKKTFWATAPPVTTIRRRKYTTTVNLLGYGNVNFTLSIGVSSIVYAVTVSRPVKLEVFGTPARTEPNPYTFIATPDHLTDDGTVILNDGSSFQSRQYNIFANLEDPAEPNVYATMTSVDQYLAATPVVLEFFYFPAVTDSGTSTGPVYLVTGGGGGNVTVGGNVIVNVSQAPIVVTSTTPTLLPGDSMNLNLVGYQGYGLYKIQVSSPAWVQIYTSASARAADSSRIINTSPALGVGLLTEVITNAASQSIKLTPAVLGFSDENPPTTTIPTRVTNLSTSAVAITISLTISYIYG